MNYQTDYPHLKQTTCLTPTAKHLSSIDIILTNRPRSFKNSVAIETGPSDHHKLIVTVLKMSLCSYTA